MKRIFFRLMVLFIARNREFFRDRQALIWNFLFPVLVIGGVVFANHNSDRPLVKVGYIGPQSQTDFFTIPQVKFISYENATVGVEKIQNYQADLVIDVQNSRYWINETNPQAGLAERLLCYRIDSTQENQTTCYSSYFTHLERVSFSTQGTRYSDWLLVGIVGMNIMYASLYGVGYVIVRYRQNGVLKRFKATPLQPWEFLTAHVLSRLFLVLTTSSLVFLSCAWVTNLKVVGSYVDLALVNFFGALCFISIALLIAARTKSEEFANGVLNLVTTPMLAISGVWFSLEGFNPLLKSIALLFPLTHVVDAGRAIMADGVGLVQVMPNLIYLGVASIVCLSIASWLFRWD